MVENIYTHAITIDETADKYDIYDIPLARSFSMRCKYTKLRQKYKIYSNLLLIDISIHKLFKIVVSYRIFYRIRNNYFQFFQYQFKTIQHILLSIFFVHYKFLKIICVIL